MKRQGANERMVVRDIVPSIEEKKVDLWKQRFENLVTALDVADIGFTKCCENERCVQVNFYNMAGTAGEFIFEDWKECDHCKKMHCGRCKKLHRCSKKSKK